MVAAMDAGMLPRSLRESQAPANVWCSRMQHPEPAFRERVPAFYLRMQYPRSLHLSISQPQAVETLEQQSEVCLYLRHSRNGLGAVAVPAVWGRCLRAEAFLIGWICLKTPECHHASRVPACGPGGRGRTSPKAES